MGEKSKIIGEYGERTVENFLKLIGWGETPKNLEVLCSRPKKHSTKPRVNRTTRCIEKDRKLDQILFGNFSNEHRIVFLWRLTSHMDNHNFKFKDIKDMEFAPDESMMLPEDFDWMHNKKELILEGKEIHNTFFTKEKKYYQYLKFWCLEARFDFEYITQKGTLTAVFTFNNYLERGDASEFQITLNSFAIVDGSQVSSTHKADIKQALLSELEK